MSRLFNEHKRVAYRRQRQKEISEVDRATSIPPAPSPEKYEDVVAPKEDTLKKNYFPGYQVISFGIVTVVCSMALVLGSQALTQTQKNDESILAAKEMMVLQKSRLEKIEQTMREAGTLQQSQNGVIAKKFDVISQAINELQINIQKNIDELSAAVASDSSVIKELSEKHSRLNTSIDEIAMNLQAVNQRLDSLLIDLKSSKKIHK